MLVWLELIIDHLQCASELDLHTPNPRVDCLHLDLHEIEVKRSRYIDRCPNMVNLNGIDRAQNCDQYSRICDWILTIWLKFANLQLNVRD